MRTQRVVGRSVDGAVIQMRLDSECPTRGAATNFYGGQTISEPSGTGSAVSRRGTTAIALLSDDIATPLLWVERLDPNVYRPGEAYSVTVTGRGFDSRVLFDFLRPGPGAEVSGDITIVSATFVSETEFHLEIELSPAAELYDSAPIAYGRKT